MINNEIDDKKILIRLIQDTADVVTEILERFIVMYSDSPEIAMSSTVDEICEHFLKILYKANRFSEFKSKLRIIKKGSNISEKEIERCDFIIKLLNTKSITILKNNISDVTGTFHSIDSKYHKTEDSNEVI